MTSRIGLAFVAFALGAGGAAFAQSKCDSAITKAATKKVACKGGVYAKAQKTARLPDSEKLAECEAKFEKACQKAKAAGDCVFHQNTCGGIEGSADVCANSLTGSTDLSACTTEGSACGSCAMGACLMDCPSLGLVCVNGQTCVPSNCTFDAECDGGAMCVSLVGYDCDVKVCCQPCP